MAMDMPPSSSSKRGGGLRGPRPQPLKVSPSSSRPSKKLHSGAGAAAPVIVYELTPKIVHARPQEFMAVVQRLTGKHAQTTTSTSPPLPTTSMYAPGFSPAVEEGAGDPLLLTLGQRLAAPLPPVPLPMASGLLMSPGFIFSPNTMQSIQELSPLF